MNYSRGTYWGHISVTLRELCSGDTLKKGRNKNLDHLGKRGDRSIRQLGLLSAFSGGRSKRDDAREEDLGKRLVKGPQGGREAVCDARPTGE